MMSHLEQITQALLNIDGENLNTLVEAALDNGIEAKDILNQGLIPAMDIVGEKMESGDMFIPEVLMAAQVMAGSVEILKPLLSDDELSAGGIVIIGTVKGDLHDIGKNLVAMMMESSGLIVHDLGVDISPEGFVKTIKEKNATILCMSALLTTTMPMMKQTVDAIVEAGLRDQVKIMIGGAPVTQSFADEIGVDAFAADAGSAAKAAKAFAA